MTDQALELAVAQAVTAFDYWKTTRYEHAAL